MRKQRLINIVGRSGSGKTTLIEKLTVHYTTRGLKVAVVKSTRHDFDTDQPGKDTARYRGAGASGAAITNGSMYNVTAEGTLYPLELAEKFFPDADLVIIEGYREGGLKKIEVIGDSKEPPLFRSGISGITFLVSDRSFDTSLPVFPRDDLPAIAEAIDIMK